ncbi:MAG: ATP-dependent zinc protease [Methylophaga sp.]|uniref:ATP-dependent zinc protease family protein n=1 Tax=Methylophaga sp. TaxID=2024840 RepID=UPI00299D6276|nr:ATP-dependent zinc protease [Methylophaga sp.]MDX1749077.1 ATP-dependent zinc protease [Methylophaga sp.]
MLKLKLPFIILVSSLLTTACIQNQSRPTVSNEQLKSALSDAESRMETQVRQQCQKIIDNQNKHQSGLQSFSKEQQITRKQLDQLNNQVAELNETLAKRAVVQSVQAIQPMETSSCPPAAPMTLNDKLVLGQTEWLWIEAVNRVFPARVDTGATTSSLTAQDIVTLERDGQKWARFTIVPEEGSDNSYEVEAPIARIANIRQSSTNELDKRPVVRLTIRIGNMTDTAEFTLTDRSHMSYPILLGREFLKDIAVVDVAKKNVQPKPEILKDRASAIPKKAKQANPKASDEE